MKFVDKKIAHEIGRQGGRSLLSLKKKLRTKNSRTSGQLVVWDNLVGRASVNKGNFQLSIFVR